MGSPNTHVQIRHTCVYTWKTHMYTTDTAHADTHKCVELESKHVLLGKHTHMCTPGTHVCVHLRHAIMCSRGHTCVFTWNAIKRVSNSGTHVCVRVEHTCVHLGHKHAQLKHTCVYTWDTHMYITGTQICVQEHRVRHKNTHYVCTPGTHTCAGVSKHKCSPKARTHVRTSKPFSA